MISHLEGAIKEKGFDRVVIAVAGVGFELLISGATYKALGETGESASLFTYLHVREDALQLFGFSSRAEKEMFLKLISVSKIGPKLALSILSGLVVSDLTRAIILGDIDLIVTIPGVGKKAAERLIMEMRGKLETDFGLSGQSMILEDSEYLKARDALLGLGYSIAEAAAALKGEALKGALAEDMIKAALKRLAKG